MSELHQISGRCHCGNLSYTFFSPIAKDELPLRTCDCSFCTRHAACYTTHPQGRLEARVRDRRLLRPYRFGTGTAEVFLCGRCGVFPFILSEIEGRRYAAINANSINDLQIDRGKLPPALHLEEQTEEERIARWKQVWIPQVSIRYTANAAIM